MNGKEAAAVLFFVTARLVGCLEWLLSLDRFCEVTYDRWVLARDEAVVWLIGDFRARVHVRTSFESDDIDRTMEQSKETAQRGSATLLPVRVVFSLLVCRLCVAGVE